MQKFIRMRFPLVLIFFTIFLLSCQSTAPADSKKLDLLYDSVVAQHDEVMPKTAAIDKAVQELRVFYSAQKDSLMQKETLVLIQDLKMAHEAMFSWMDQFKNKHLEADFYQNTAVDSLQLYLREEEKKIQKVAQLMNQSLQAYSQFKSKHIQ